MTSLIFAATASPPTGHADGGISPFAMAAASPSHPGYPHPPQLFPGRSSLTAISFSSTSTLNFSPATPRRIPITIPTPATTATAINIPVIPHPPYINPEKPKNAIAMRPDVMRTIGVPLNDSGIGLCSSLSLIPASITIAMVKPTADPHPLMVLSSMP